jgi:hypothetical protein
MSPSPQGEENVKERELREKIRGSLRHHLLPRLCGTLAGKAKGPTAVADEDELVQRVPLAGPIVRLLQLDSAAAVERHVPGIVAKLGSFLKSKVTRTVTRHRVPTPSTVLWNRNCFLQFRLLKSYGSDSDI